MKAVFGIVLAAMLAVGLAMAQDVPNGFEEIGRFEISIGGVPETFIGAREVATGRSYFNVQNIAGMTSINVAGKSIAEGAGARIVSILIGPYSGNPPATATFELYDGTDILAGNEDTGLMIDLANVQLSDDGAFSFAFSGLAVPATRGSDGTMTAVAGREPVAVQGRFAGQLPTGG